MRNIHNMLRPKDVKHTPKWSTWVNMDDSPLPEQQELTAHETLHEIQRFRQMVTSGEHQHRTLMLSADNKPDMVLGNTHLDCPQCGTNKLTIIPKMSQPIEFDAEEEARLQQCSGFIMATAIRCINEHEFMMCVGQAGSRVVMWVTGLHVKDHHVQRHPKTHNLFKHA